MRPHAYASPLLLLLLACGPSSDDTDDTGATPTSTTGTTGTTSPSEDPTSTSSTTAEPATTGTTTTGEPATTASATTLDPLTTRDATDTSTGGQLVGKPATHSEGCPPNPEDGFAAEFQLELSARMCDASPVDAELRLVLYKDVYDVQLGANPIAGGLGMVYYKDANGTRTGEAGTLTVAEITDDGLRGTYDVTLSDNTQLSGDFDSLYCALDLRCN